MAVGGEDGAKRSRRVQGVIRDCIRRRVAGEPLSDEEVASDHPDVIEEVKKILEDQHAPSTIDRFKFKVLGD